MKMTIQSLGARSGMYRKVVITIEPGFWGRHFGKKAEDVTFLGRHGIWFQEGHNSPAKKKIANRVNALISEYEADASPTP